MKNGITRKIKIFVQNNFFLVAQKKLYGNVKYAIINGGRVLHPEARASENVPSAIK